MALKPKAQKKVDTNNSSNNNSNKSQNSSQNNNKRKVADSQHPVFKKMGDVRNQLKQRGFNPDDNLVSILTSLGFPDGVEFENIWYVDNKYLVSDDGMFRIDYNDRKFTYHLKRLSHCPVFPKTSYNVVSNDSNTSNFVGIDYLDSDMELVKDFTISQDNMFKNPALTGKTFLKSSNNTESLEDAFIHIRKQLKKAGKLKKEIGYISTGFVFDNDNNITDYIHLGHKNYLNNYKKYEKTGTFEEWLKTFQSLSTGHPINAFLAACAIGSYSKPLVGSNIYNPLINIISPGGSGKSSEMLALTSIETKPIQGGFKYVDAKSTLYSLQQIFSINNHSFICLDELDKVFEENYNSNKAKTDILNLLNTGTKGRGNRTGGFSTGTATNNLVIASGNKDLKEFATGSSTDTPLHTRALEIKYDDEEIRNLVDGETTEEKNKVKEKFRKDSNFFLERLNNNYGHCVEYIVDYLMNNHNYVKDNVFEEYRDTLEDMFSQFSNVSRKIELFGFVYVGIHILENAIEPDNPVIANKANEVLNILVNRQFELEKEKENSNIDNLIDFVNVLHENAGNFTHNNYLFSHNNDTTDEQRSNAIEVSKKAKSGNTKCYGTITSEPMNSHTDFKGQIDLTKKGLDFVLYELAKDKDEFLKSFEELGIIKSNENYQRKLKGKETDRIQKETNVRTTRVYTFYLLGDYKMNEIFLTSKGYNYFQDNEENEQPVNNNGYVEIEQMYEGAVEETKTKEEFKEVFKVDPDDLVF